MRDFTHTIGGRVVIAGIGVLLIVIGGLLVVRPLTAVAGLVGAIAVCSIVGAGLMVAGERAIGWRWAAATALVSGAALCVVFFPAVVRWLPAFVAVLLVVGGTWLVFASVKRGTTVTRTTGVAYAIASMLLAVLVWVWPDVATIACGAGFALAIFGSGIILLLRAIRSRNGRARPQRPVLRMIGALVVLVFVMGAAWSSVQLRGDLPTVDDFYSWDTEIPAVPGQVLRTAPYDGALPVGVHAIRILYATTYSDGSPALASAVVAYSDTPAREPRQILAWQHGTTGVARACAPSVGDQALTEYAIPGISRAIDRDWVVVATDYPGQGTTGRYPYLIGEGEGRATLDGIRAAGQIDGAYASSSAWVWGHSQGGHATLWAAQIAVDYAPEIDILGVAALSAASDPLALAERITGARSSALGEVVTSLVLVPYADEYADVDLGASVHPAGQGIVETFARRCVTDATTLISVLVGTALRLDSPLYRIDVGSGPTHDRLAENIADGVVPAPLFLGQGTDDEVIPIDTQRTLDARLCEARRAVETHEYPGRTHMGVIAEDSPLIDDLYSWVDLVTQGYLPSTCP
ncbi:uncharacterized membrane protein HdeD (DUF308 family) [Microbacterium saperdae]|uniref:Uncharacterized membrane protein HdeD (DUF308 family) n=1 Tax=Microbacterium saperdae TaxID=69368 RepID=A0A543BLE7_9MICO|nr:uncharacterized membrane protein HdeD (DUF308 family) [Microbacterium saperdae]